MDASLAEQARQLRPNLIVPSPIFVGRAGLQLHAESVRRRHVIPL
jgi:hypothetical protein